MEYLSGDTIYEIFKHRPNDFDHFCNVDRRTRQICASEYIRDRIKLYWMKKYDKLLDDITEQDDTIDEDTLIGRAREIMQTLFPAMPYWIGEEF